MRALLLEEAARVVSASGEQALRTKAVASAVGVTEPALFHYFGSREGLIEEVQAHRFELTQIDLFSAFRDEVMKCTSRQRFAEIVTDALNSSFAKPRSMNRAARIDIAGSSVSRPRLKARLAEAQRRSLTGAADALEYARERGWVRPDLEIEAFLYWVAAQTGGRFFAELGTDAETLKKWNDTVIRATLTELGLEPTPDQKKRAPVRRRS